MSDSDCIWCRIYKRDRDKARDRLARALTGEEHILVRKLRKEIRVMQVALERRNRQVDALLLVWCDGGCETGVHRYHQEQMVTQEMVDEAVRNTERLQRWWRNRQCKQRNAEWREAGKGKG